MSNANQSTNPNTNTNPMWQQLANMNANYPTSLVQQQPMNSMNPTPGMFNSMNGLGLGSAQTGLRGQSLASINPTGPGSGGGGKQPSQNSGGFAGVSNAIGGMSRGFGGGGSMGQLGSAMQNGGVGFGGQQMQQTPFNQSYQLGQNVGRAIMPMFGGQSQVGQQMQPQQIPQQNQPAPQNPQTGGQVMQPQNNQGS